MIVSTPDRHLVALGADDPMKIGFLSQETSSTWTATATNTAESVTTRWIKIVGAKRTRGRIIWTDTTLHSMHLGTIYFGFRELATGCGWGPLAVVEINGLVWMGINQFCIRWIC